MIEKIVRYKDGTKGDYGVIVGDLIRCADCKYYDFESTKTSRYCHNPDGMIGAGDGDYCPYGKKRDEK